MDAASAAAGASCTIDPATGNVTVDPGKATGPITVTVSDPSGAPIGNQPVVTVAAMPLTDNLTPAYQPTTVQAGQSATVAAPTFTDASGATVTPPADTTYAAGTGAPSWATVNPDGSITVAPDASVPAGTTSIPVLVTYPDGSVDNVSAPVTVTAAPVAAPSWGDGTTAAGSPVTLPNTGGPVPFGSTCAVDAASAAAGATCTIDPATGNVTVDPGTTTGPITVTVSDPSGAPIGNQPIVSVDPAPTPASDASQFQPAYQPTTLQAGQSVTIAAPTFTDASGATVTPPAGTKYAAGTGAPSWATANPDGSITVAPGATVPAGPTNIPVVVTYPDGSVDNVTAPVTITAAPSKDTTAPTINPIADQAVTAGTPITPVTVTTDDPTATVTVTGLPTGTNYDPATGQISGTPTTPGTYPVTVIATDPAGNKSTETFTITVNPAPAPTADAAKYQPVYTDGTVQQGQSATIPVPTFTDASGATVTLPAGMKHAAGTGAPSWATVNPDGSITVAPGATVPAGGYTVPVTVTYPDGSTDAVNVPVTVTAAPAKDTTAPTIAPIANQTIDLGSPIAPITVTTDDPTATVTVTGLPAGTSYDPATGKITGTPTELGTFQVTVVATDPAGNSAALPFTITVNPVSGPAPTPTPTADALTPAYTDTTVQQGKTATVPVPTFTDNTGAVVTNTTGTTFAPGTGVPLWATVNPDGSITVAPGATVPAGKYTVPVVITYQDGSKETATATVTVTAAPAANTQAQDNTPGYAPGSGQPGQTVTLPQTGDTTMPAGTTYTSDNPAVHVDPITGEVTVDIPADAAGGTTITGTITVTYPDGSKDTAPVTVKVVTTPATQASQVEPYYGVTTGKIGDTLVSQPPLFDVTATGQLEAHPVPAGATFAIGAPGIGTFTPIALNPANPAAAVPAGAKITIDPTTGVVTWVGPMTAGTYNIPVEVTYADGSKDWTYATFIVTGAGATDAQSHAPSYPGGTGLPGATVTLPQTGDATVPAGSGYTSDNPAVHVDPTTGEVTVQIPADAKLGSTITATITVTYPDGSTDTTPVTVTVGKPTQTGAETGTRSTGSLGELGLGSLGGGTGNGGSGSLGELFGGSLGGNTGNGSSGSSNGSTSGSDSGSANGSGSTGSLDAGSLGALGTGSAGSSGSSAGAGSSAGSVAAFGSLALGGLAIGGLVWALNNHIIALPAGFVLPPFLAPFFPGLVNAGQSQPTQPPVAPGPQVDNGRG